MPVDAITFTPAEKKEVERVVRAVTEAGKEVSSYRGPVLHGAVRLGGPGGAAVVDGIVEVRARPRMPAGLVGQRRGGWRRNVLSDVIDVGGVMWDELERERERVEDRAAVQRTRVELEEESTELLRIMAELEQGGREEARTEGAGGEAPQLREVERNGMVGGEWLFVNEAVEIGGAEDEMWRRRREERAVPVGQSHTVTTMELRMVGGVEMLVPVREEEDEGDEVVNENEEERQREALEMAQMLMRAHGGEEG